MKEAGVTGRVPIDFLVSNTPETARRRRSRAVDGGRKPAST